MGQLLETTADRRGREKLSDMEIAVINETSSASRNADIIAALEGQGHEIPSVAMTTTGTQPELSYRSSPERPSPRPRDLEEAAESLKCVDRWDNFI